MAIKPFLIFALMLIAIFSSYDVLACVGCGQTKVFTPKTLAISMSFILLPVTIVTLVALKLRRDAKLDAELSSKKQNTSFPNPES